MMTRVKKQQLTYKETMLVEAKVNGMPNAKAYIAAGYSADRFDIAEANARKVLARPRVKNALQIALKKHGITLDIALAPIGKALIATKLNDNKETVEDIDLQLKGSDRALKLMGVGQDIQANTVNFVQVVQAQKDKYGF